MADRLLENLSNKEIGSRLHVSERTAKFHISKLLAKYGVQHRADLRHPVFAGRRAPGRLVNRTQAGDVERT